MHARRKQKSTLCWTRVQHLVPSTRSFGLSRTKGNQASCNVDLISLDDLFVRDALKAEVVKLRQDLLTQSQVTTVSPPGPTPTSSTKCESVSRAVQVDAAAPPATPLNACVDPLDASIPEPSQDWVEPTAADLVRILRERENLIDTVWELEAENAQQAGA